MDYQKVMALPMRVFWQLSGSVHRLVADEQKQLLEILTASKVPENATQLHEALHKLSPDPIKFSDAARMQVTAERDQDATARLRRLAGVPNTKKRK